MEKPHLEKLPQIAFQSIGLSGFTSCNKYHLDGKFCRISTKVDFYLDIRIEFASCLLVSSASRMGASDAPEQSRQLHAHNWFFWQCLTWLESEINFSVKVVSDFELEKHCWKLRIWESTSVLYSIWNLQSKFYFWGE